MFRTWVFDVRQSLKPGTNDLQVQFQALPELQEINDLTAAYIKQHPEVQDGNARRHFWRPWSWIRKAPTSGAGIGAVPS